MDWIVIGVVVAIIGVIATIAVPVVLSRRSRRGVQRVEVVRRNVLVPFDWVTNTVQPELEGQGYEVILPSPERAFLYLNDGWEHILQPDRGTGEQLNMCIGGTEQHPHHVVLRRRKLTDSAKRTVVAMHQNGLRPRTFQHITGGRIPLIAAGDYSLQGDEATRVIETLRALGLIAGEEGEYNRYRLTQRGMELAERLVAEGVVWR